MKRLLLAATMLAAVLVAAPNAHADPCGMVPPITVEGDTPITRIGLQKTYVFHKDGVETFVIRPGFAGKVDEFGMLIPFPEPPALRKVPDNIFPHIGAAIDPPEVVVNLFPPPPMAASAPGGGGGGDFSDPFGEAPLAIDAVRVLKTEAVGMYEVAVLAAGSSKALKKWMDDHEYRFPTGMDDVCDDYIDDRWCFVAVKTKVGDKDRASPRAGQRGVSTKLPPGAAFDGHVQAMGFRFRSKELVVPMRLSAFNAGDMRNVVYILTDGPKKIRSIPEEYVVRQINGKELLGNVTDPLPIRVLGGTAADIPAYRRKSLPKQRDPEQFSLSAKELFASDLIACETDDLTLSHEEDEKTLLAIGEELGLRGAKIDEQNSRALAESRKKTTADGVKKLASMTLTVVDGDFPRDVISSQNLTFGSFVAPKSRNYPQLYNAREFGPQKPKKGGTIHRGILPPMRDKPKSKPPRGGGIPIPGIGNPFGMLPVRIFGIALLGLAICFVLFRVGRKS